MCEADGQDSRSFLALPGFAIKCTGSPGRLAGQALKAAVSRQREFLADARAVQFTRSKDGLGGVLRKALGQGHEGQPTHPSVQHLLLLAPCQQGHWLNTHPPIAERIRWIYGHAMGALSSEDVAPTRPDVIF